MLAPVKAGCILLFSSSLLNLVTGEEDLLQREAEVEGLVDSKVLDKRKAHFSQFVHHHGPTAPVSLATAPHPATTPYEGPVPNCHIEEVELEAEVCTPTVETKCEKVTVETKNIGLKEKCVPLIKTVCTQTETQEDNEICFYEYEKKDEATKASTVQVQFEKECEEQRQGGYGGYGYGQNQVMEVCYNSPKVSPLEKDVTVSYPVPVKKCINNPITLPQVTCEDVEEEKCFSLPSTTPGQQELDQCSTQLGPPDCKIVKVKLPKQICVTKKQYTPPAPSYHAPAPTYHTPPAPSYPTPNYHTPAPTYHDPALTYHTPLPKYPSPAPYTNFG